MTTPEENAIAVAAVERQLVDAKREAKDYETRGLAVPEHVARRITNLKGAATALRNGFGDSSPP